MLRTDRTKQFDVVGKHVVLYDTVDAERRPIKEGVVRALGPRGIVVQVGYDTELWLSDADWEAAPRKAIDGA